MSGRFIDRLYYRNTSTYPSGTVNLSSGFSKIPAGSTPLNLVIIEEKGSAGIEPALTRKKGNGNAHVVSEKATFKVNLMGVNAADYAALRSAFINTDVDIVLVDSNNPTVGYLTHNICVYPKGTLEGGNTYSVELSGECERGSGVSSIPHNIITVSGVS
jgi:hypothetical protein